MTAAAGGKLKVVELQNEFLQVSVLPDIGAKIFDLIHRPSGHNFLWHNSRIPPQPYPVDGNFDNYWCGGWDDGFPTCEACSYQGEQYPNLGEFRSVRWQVQPAGREEANPSVTLAAFGPISPVRAQKTIRLHRERLEMEFRIEHIGYLPIDFLWGTHPALAIEPDCVIHIPARSGLVGQANDPKLGTPGQRYSWPTLASGLTSGLAPMLTSMLAPRDMRFVLPPGKLAAGHYALDLAAGWYALEYPAKGIGILFEFPVELCPYLWLWLSYGGWRGYYVAVIEPWTGCPVTLSEAAAANTHKTLAPGEVFSCLIRATPWSQPSTLDELLQRRQLTKE